jgi:sialate O-acetylesterase
MIAPLIPYGIKGAIWYQGESNSGQADYAALFGDMITDWRQRWDEGDFPFLFVQLARYKDPNPGFAVIREAQLKTLALPDTGMAAVYDIGDEADIHPKDKLDVGLRLALAAKHIAYGQNVVYSGPIYDKMTVEGGAIRVSFTQTGSGLEIGTAPWTPPTAQPLPNTTLAGFMIAGADKTWQPAEAKIDGNDVVVSSAQVPQPVAVRYAFVTAQGNLYNKEGLPASPFRTDAWDVVPPKPAAVPPVAPPPLAK